MVVVKEDSMCFIRKHGITKDPKNLIKSFDMHSEVLKLLLTERGPDG